MKLRSRDINIFSMSALDLFASAMGAFMLLAVMALPFFPNTGDSKERVADVKKELEKAKKDAQKAKSQSDQLKKQIEKMVKFALLGIATSAESFVIVIDMSGSMQDYEDLVVRTFRDIVKPFNKSNSIQILGYQGNDNEPPEIHSWQSRYNLIKLSDVNKKAATAYVESLANRFDRGTPTWAALQDALNYKAQAILLLSDGAPNEKNIDLIISDITSKNNGKEIHAIAIGNYLENPELVRFLSELARKNNGAFVGVAK